jgi:hypothetical protein
MPGLLCALAGWLNYQPHIKRDQYFDDRIRRDAETNRKTSAQWIKARHQRQ